MIFAPFDRETPTVACSSPDDNGRKIPHVKIDAQPAFTCTVVPVPRVGAARRPVPRALQRRPNPVVTVRQKDVEKVYCPSPEAGKATFARLTGSDPTTFTTVSHGPGARSRGRHPGPGRVTAMRSHAVVVGREHGRSARGPVAARTTTSGSRSSTATTSPRGPSREAASRRVGTPMACWPRAGPSSRRCSRPDLRPDRSRCSPRRRRPRGRLVLHATASGPPRERADGAAGQPRALEWYVRSASLPARR
jgi:hypothetical protein